MGGRQTICWLILQEQDYKIMLLQLTFSFKAIFITLFLLSLWGYGITYQFSKQIRNLFFQTSIQVYYLIVQADGRGMVFFSFPGSRSEDRGFMPHEITPKSTRLSRETKKVSRFVKLEIVLTPLCYLIHPIINKFSRAWSFLINVLEGFQDVFKSDLLSPSGGLIITYSFQE